MNSCMMELEDCLCFLLWILLLPLYPFFYLSDCIFDTEIMYDGSSLHEPPSPYRDEE